MAIGGDVAAKFLLDFFSHILKRVNKPLLRVYYFILGFFYLFTLSNQQSSIAYRSTVKHHRAFEDHEEEACEGLLAIGMLECGSSVGFGGVALNASSKAWFIIRRFRYWYYLKHKKYLKETT